VKRRRCDEVTWAWLEASLSRFLETIWIANAAFWWCGRGSVAIWQCLRAYRVANNNQELSWNRDIGRVLRKMMLMMMMIRVTTDIRGHSIERLLRPGYHRRAQCDLTELAVFCVGTVLVCRVGITLGCFGTSSTTFPSRARLSVCCSHSRLLLQCSYWVLC